MPDENLTHIYFLLDRSGSMQSIRKSTISGFDAFIRDQRTAPGKCLVSLSQFDTEYDDVYADRPIADVGSLELEPRGSTAMLDSIARLITEAGQRLESLPESQRPGSVVIGIMTDGLENASVKHSHADIKAMIEHQTNVYSWRFIYMGADQDAIEVGARIGIDADHALTYSRSSVDAAFAVMSDSMKSYRFARAAGMSAPQASKRSSFTEEHRKRATK